MLRTEGQFWTAPGLKVEVSGKQTRQEWETRSGAMGVI